MNKILTLCLAVIIIFANTGCDISNAKTGGNLPKVVMVSSKGSLSLESYNHTAYEGVMRAADDYNLEIVLKEPEGKEEYMSAVFEAAEEGADLIIAIGQSDSDSIIKLAKDKPETLFAVIDASLDAPDNVMCLSFRNEEGAFLIGVIAALTTETGVVGFVGGIRNAAVEAFEYGFKAGVKSAGNQVDVLTSYTDSFDDSQKGKEAALSLIENGADVIFHESGDCGDGVIEAADSSEVWAISADLAKTHPDSDNVLCSMFKRVDNGVYLSIQSFMEGKFHSGVYKFGLDFEAVGYSDTAGNLTKEVKAEADKFAQAILAGNMQVPGTSEQFKSFEVPDLELI